MSYSNKNSTFNSPVVADIEWAGGIKKGYLKRYDKENKCDIPIEGEFGFMELDVRTAIKGFSKANNCGIFSNEVEKMSEENLDVFSFKNGKKVALQVHNPIDNTYIDIKPGLYKDIKISLKAAGGKYTSVVYALVTKSSDSVATVGSIVRIYVNGSMLSPYIENAKRGFEVLINPEKKAKTTVGDNTFWVPSIEPAPIDADMDKNAMDADEKLQQFFLEYKRSKNTATDIGEELGAETVPSSDDIEEDVGF